MSNVLVFIEQRDGKIREASFEALTLGREVAAKTGGALAAVVGAGLAEGEDVFTLGQPAAGEVL